MTWNFDSNAPIYIQIMDELKRQIISEELKPGEKIPAVRELAQEAGVNPNTMQRALTELEREELIYAVRTSGRYVTVNKELIDGTKENLAKEKILELADSLKKMGFSQSEILEFITETIKTVTEE